MVPLPCKPEHQIIRHCHLPMKITLDVNGCFDQLEQNNEKHQFCGQPLQFISYPAINPMTIHPPPIPTYPQITFLLQVPPDAVYPSNRSASTGRVQV